MKLILKLVGGLLLIGVILMFMVEADPFGAAKERKAQEEAKQKVEATITESSIRLVDGELGEYGEGVTIPSQTYGEYTYVWYRIPAGDYTVITEKDGRTTVFVVGDESSEDVRSTTYLTEYGESQDITVEEGSHIELSVGATILLNPKE